MKVGISEAAKILNASGVVAYPTETLYGLGANAYSDAAVSAVFSCKERSQSKPISVAYKSLEAASEDVEINKLAQCIANNFLPGPVTIVVRKKLSSKISLLCSGKSIEAGSETVGIRIPNHPLALKLLQILAFPLTASSANISGNASHTTAESVEKDFPKIAVLDGGECSVKIASTVVDCSSFSEENKLIIKREGAISTKEILEKCSKHIPLLHLFFLVFVPLISCFAASYTRAETDVFVSLKSSEVNMRVGPGKEYPISWVFMRAYLPMQLIAEFDQWRKVKFMDGTTGWVHKNMISRKSTAIVLNSTVMYKFSSKKYPIAKLEKGVVVEVDKSDGEFIKVRIGNLKGWVEKEFLWGFLD